MEQLTGVCNILAQGKAPKVLAKFLAGANLIGSPKKDKQDLRPIAIGETLRRLVSKGLCKNACSSVKNYLWPIQLSVNISNGSEIAINTLRNYCENLKTDSGKVLMKLDIKMHTTLFQEKRVLMKLQLISHKYNFGLIGAIQILQDYCLETK